MPILTDLPLSELVIPTFGNGRLTRAERAAALPDPVSFPLFPDTPVWTMRVELDGAPFTFRLDYSGREDRWYLSIYDASGAAVRRGMKVVPNWNVLRQCQNDGRPAGVVMFSDPRAFDASAPGFAALGRAVGLFYFPAE